MTRREEYAVLVLVVEEHEAGRDARGGITFDLDLARRVFLAAARSKATAGHERARTRFEQQLRMYENKKNTYLRARRSYEAAMVKHREQAANHAKRVRAYEDALADHRRAVTHFREAELEHEHALSDYQHQMAIYRNSFFKGAKEAPAHPGPGPVHPGPPPSPPPPMDEPPPPPTAPEEPEPPPPLPTDAELLKHFKPELVTAWVARLFDGATATDLGAALPEQTSPPPFLVTQTLNAVAGNGWAVAHVGEDRSLVDDDLQLVAVRYLLRRAS